MGNLCPYPNIKIEQNKKINMFRCTLLHLSLLGTILLIDFLFAYWKKKKKTENQHSRVSLNIMRNSNHQNLHED